MLNSWDRFAVNIIDIFFVFFQRVICEHDIGNIFCACQDGDNMNYFAYITREMDTEKNYCHVFCVASTVSTVCVCYRQTKYCFFLNFDISPLRSATDTHVWVSKPGWIHFVCFLACVILRFTSGATPAGCIEVSMAAKPFWFTYLQTCLQALVEVQSGAQTDNHLCCNHSAVYHWATPARPTDRAVASVGLWGLFVYLCYFVCLIDGWSGGMHW